MESATEQIAAQTPRRRPRFIVAGVSFAGIVLALLTFLVLTGAERLEPDEVVRNCGRYVSPGRRFQVVVSETENDTVRIVVESPNPWKRFLSRFRNSNYPYPGLIAETEVELDWFLCFDEYDRLWMFLGPWDRGWGPLRQLPSGGTGGYTQHVEMYGFFFLGPRPVGGMSTVSHRGDWRGVPPKFFGQIPGKEDTSVAVWGTHPTIPATPTKFTRAERTAAASFWK